MKMEVIIQDSGLMERLMVLELQNTQTDKLILEILKMAKIMVKEK